LGQALRFPESPPISHSPSAEPPPPFLFADATHPRRRRIEQFIEARFQRAFGARLPRHHPILACICADDGEDAILAAAGLRFAEDGPLFLEQYLNAPVDQAVAEAFGRPVAREGIVEIGSLASDSPDASLRLFAVLASWLATHRGRRFAVATVRPETERLLTRAGFGLTALGHAHPDRLRDGAGDWGCYYDRLTQVFAGEIGDSSVLPALRQRLRTRAMDRAVRRLRRNQP